MNQTIAYRLLLLLCLLPSLYFAQTGLNFDGTDDYVSSPFTGISGNGDRTIEAWIRTTANAIPGQGGQRVIANWGSMTTGTRFTFNVLWGNAIRLEIGGSGVSGTIAVNDGNWHHVAVSYKAGTVSLYVDGVLDVSSTLSGVNTSSGSFMIGRRVDGVNHFEGDIDEVRIWNTALSASQLAINDSNEICVAPSNLLAYYKFNEGVAGANNSSVSSLVDDAGTNNGSLHNFSLNGTGSNYISSPLLGSDVQLNETITACGPYIALNGQTYTQSGLYQDTLSNSGACDTLYSLNLTVVSLDSSATRISANQIQANESDSNATYQWLDCNDGMKAIQGVRNRTFNIVQNGNYAVEVSLNGCVDTSACINISNIGLQERHSSEFQMFPNPAKDQIKLNLPVGLYNKYEILNLNGQVLKSGSLSKAGKNTIKLSEMIPGIYLLQVNGPQEYRQSKLIIE